MTILITGSREWTNGRRIVERLLQEPDGTVIIEGGAMGADSFAAHAAMALGFKRIEVRADWGKYGKSAGPIRNRQMLDMKPDLVLAFCKNRSRGTMDCVNEALARKIPVELVDAEEA